MLLSPGEIVFVISRRLFDSDLRRSFVGEVKKVSEVAIRAKGYRFLFDIITNDFVKTKYKREHIFSLIDAGICVRILPDDVNYKHIKYGWDAGQRIITDGNFKMAISEFGIHR